MATVAELKGKIEKMQKVIDNPDTSPDIRKSLEMGVKGAKEALSKLEAEGKKEASAKPDEKKEKASPTARKEARSALDKCRELLKKYEDKKDSDADRIEKRRKAGKPAELTPAEAVSKGAKSVKSKVVDMTEKDKHLKKSEINAMVSAIVETVKSTISGIEGAQARDEFINSLIDRLSDMKSRSKSRAESGMFVDTSGPGVKDKVISWIGLNREKLDHFTDTEFIIHMMEIINHFPHAVGIMKMGGSIPDVEFTVMYEGKRTKVIAKSVKEAREKGAIKLGADPEDVSAMMSSYDIHADMFSYHPEKEMADGGMMDDDIQIGDLVRVKKFGWVMRVVDIDDDMFELENDKEGISLGGKAGNPGGYYKSDISKYADGGMMARGGRLVDNYLNQLEAMTDEQLADEVVYEMGFDKDEVMADIEDERDDYIKELVHRFKLTMRSRGEMADGGMMAMGGKVDKVEDEIFDAIYKIYSDPSNKDRYGQVHIRNYNASKLKSLLSEEAYKYLESGNSVYGKLGLYGGQLGTYYAVNPTTAFYDKKRGMADGGMMARGGRPLSAINRDRAYQSDEEWEKNYKRRSAPSNPRYSTED